MLRITLILTILTITGCATTQQPVYRISAKPTGDKIEFDLTVEYQPQLK